MRFRTGEPTRVVGVRVGAQERAFEWQRRWRGLHPRGVEKGGQVQPRGRPDPSGAASSGGWGTAGCTRWRSGSSGAAPGQVQGRRAWRRTALPEKLGRRGGRTGGTRPPAVSQRRGGGLGVSLKELAMDGAPRRGSSGRLAHPEEGEEGAAERGSQSAPRVSVLSSGAK